MPPPPGGEGGQNRASVEPFVGRQGEELDEVLAQGDLLEDLARLLEAAARVGVDAGAGERREGYSAGATSTISPRAMPSSITSQAIVARTRNEGYDCPPLRKSTPSCNSFTGSCRWP